ncbi:hypothetical protein KEM52_001118 [Ascosphaera acerosa]|nr:hypothetical protein KEM52_001118 [Ascosphaera acerosa]
MPSFTRIFKHAHASRDKEKERGRAADPVIATDTSATATAAADDALPTTSFTTTISSPTGQVTSSPSIVNPTPAVPASPDYQGLLSHKSRRKKEKEKEKERARLIRRATGDDLSQHHQHQQWLQQQHHQHQQAGWRPFAEQSAAPSADSQSDAWQKTYVEAGEVAELIAAVIKEIKLRALDTPFLLLPFRPSATPSDLTSARTFIRNYYRRAANIGLIPPTDSQSQSQSRSKSQSFSSSPGGQALLADVKLLDPPALCNILKWLWARLKGGVVGWEVYSLFKVGEQDSGFARTAFSTFIPLAVDAARAAIITDFFDLLASVAAHAKANGLSGRKLSRYAGWWAFEHSASRAVTTTPAATAGAGAPQFTDSYNHWEDAAHATSHMFFAFLRSQIPDPALSIQSVPISLRELERDTEYPPPRDAALRRHATMAVYTVGYLSSIPLAAVRRAAATPLDDLDVMDLSDSDGKSLQWFTKLDNPIQQGLTDESVRILKSMGKVAGTFGTPSLGSGDATAAAAAVLSGGGQSRRQSLSSWSAASDSSSEVPALAVSKKKRQSWSQFEDIGFDGVGFSDRPRRSSRDERATKQASERPHTPSWAEFLSSGFVEPADAQEDRMALQLPHEHVLPPLPSQRQRGEGVPSRATSSQTNAHYGGRRSGVSGDHRAELAGAEVARITALELDESFFWVWITSLAPEETPARRAVFGHCVLVEIKSSPEGHLNQAASVSTKGGSGGAAASVVSGGSGTYARDSAGKWLLVEERVKVAPPPVAEEEDAAAAVVERKGTLFA